MIMFDMLGNVFKNLVSKPATRRYPAAKREPFKGVRGRLDIDIDKCIFCGICARKCPSDAITVNKTNKSWELDPFKCIICSACADVCPKKCLYMHAEHKTAAYQKENLKYEQRSEATEEGA